MPVENSGFRFQLSINHAAKPFCLVFSIVVFLLYPHQPPVASRMISCSVIVSPLTSPTISP